MSDEEWWEQDDEEEDEDVDVRTVMGEEPPDEPEEPEDEPETDDLRRELGLYRKPGLIDLTRPRFVIQWVPLTLPVRWRYGL